MPSASAALASDHTTTADVAQTRAAIGKALKDNYDEVVNIMHMFTVAGLDTVTASMAKLWIADIQTQVMDECLQLFGGYGYSKDYPISQLYVDARVQPIYGGASEVMKEIIARSL